MASIELLGLLGTRFPKMLSALLLAMLVFGSAYGQTYGEFFRQKRTQERYLLQQLAALKVYGQALQKGYSVVSGGLGVIRDLSDGEFRLHELFISSLKVASPLVRGSPKVGEIIAMQVYIARTLPRIKGTEVGVLLEDYFSGMLVDCAGDLEELLMVIVSGRLEMGEAQRLERIDKVHHSMAQRYVLVKKVAGEVGILEELRRQDELESKKMERLYGIN